MQEHLVNFRLVVPLPGLEVGPRLEHDIQFAARDLRLSLLRTPDGEGRFTDDIVMFLTAEREVSPEVHAELIAFSSERRKSHPVGPAASDLPGDLFILTGPDALWFMAPPENVAAVFGDIAHELSGPAARLADILRWRFNRPHPAHPLRDAELTWSLEGDEWLSAPGGAFHAPVLGSTGPILEPQDFEPIFEWWASEEPPVPVSRLILVEANHQLGENNRAAVSMAVAAIEVGVKEFCSAQGAESEAWLLREMPTPPVRKLLRDYVVFFTQRRGKDGALFPKALLSQIESAVEARNRIVHRGERPASDEESARVLAAASDLLYLLDWLAGHDWALDYVSKEVAAAYR